MDEIAVNKIRRNERAQTNEWIEGFLETHDVITISMIDHGLPYAVVRNYVYVSEQGVVYFHGARQGRTYETLSKHPMVCCTAHKMGRLLPAQQGAEFSVEYASVTFYGKVRVIEQTEEARSALERLAGKYFPNHKPGEDYSLPTEETTQATAVYRVDIISWSGKQNKAADDYPRAFEYKPDSEQEAS
jgi:nitroimidazol reductase NimA-like FMN-containing flavoprotein (pyridoxamine 5'-phosphate oxidase superfamily)